MQKKKETNIIIKRLLFIITIISIPLIITFLNINNVLYLDSGFWNSFILVYVSILVIFSIYIFHVIDTAVIIKDYEDKIDFLTCLILIIFGILFICLDCNSVKYVPCNNQQVEKVKGDVSIIDANKYEENFKVTCSNLKEPFVVDDISEIDYEQKQGYDIKLTSKKYNEWKKSVDEWNKEHNTLSEEKILEKANN